LRMVNATLAKAKTRIARTVITAPICAFKPLLT
jgi:hypothetical protein